MSPINPSDYFSWIDRHTRRAGVRLRGKPPAPETPRSAADSIQVEDHHASTTVIEKIRDAIRERFRGSE